MFKLFAIMTVTVVSSAFIWGSMLLWGTAVSLLLLCGFWAYNRYAFIQIPEMEVGVIFNKRRQAFARFTRSGRHPFNPLLEQYSHSIPTETGSANGRCLDVQTSGGIALDIDWSVSYDIDPFQIKAAARPKLARKLPKKGGSIVSKHLNNCMRHVIGEFSVDQLIEPGSGKRLERAVRQQLTARLSEAGFSFSRVMVGAIEMPTHVKAALEAVQERAVQTENEVRSLERLQQVISQFSEADMQRLMELERINKLGQNGVTLMVPALGGQALKAQRPSYAKVKRNRISRSALS
ncbi:MAG: SPFH domain-containing protein [Chloroflexi bacterium]|nr:SPFH domain-containing protein [Chloroflexota bacterium]